MSLLSGLHSPKRLATVAEAAPGPGRDNLVSFVVLATTEGSASFTQALGALADARYDFYEIIHVGSAVDSDGFQREREALAGVSNLRVIAVGAPSDFDHLLGFALAAAIGDFVVVAQPGDVTPGECARLVDRCALGGLDIVRAVQPAAAARPAFRALNRLAGGLVRLMVGRGVDPFQRRAFCLSRAALARLTDAGRPFSTFRLLDLGDLMREEKMEVAPSARRAGLRALWRRAGLVARLIALRTPDLLTGLAVILTGAGMIAVAYAAYAVGVWIVLDTVAPGWLTLSLLGALTAMLIFLALAALCLGLTQLITPSRLGVGSVATQEFSSADLFARTRRLNVEVAQPKVGDA